MSYTYLASSRVEALSNIWQSLHGLQQTGLVQGWLLYSHWLAYRPVSLAISLSWFCITSTSTSSAVEEALCQPSDWQICATATRSAARWYWLDAESAGMVTGWTAENGEGMVRDRSVMAEHWANRTDHY